MVCAEAKKAVVIEVYNTRTIFGGIIPIVIKY
jgi:hypothetical protein